METVLPAGAYADSIDSLSPRSRGAESWDEPFAPAPATKLRLMCSYGGQIVPRPHDRTLCYLGGETRLLVVDRHTTLSDFHDRLSRTLLDGRLFSLKYQLPSEDLDSLISLSTDEDLENMLEEYDRLATSSSSSGSGRSFRLRLFLFPAKPDPPPSTTTMGSLLDDSKSETWFVDALNSAMLGPDSASSSVNCLLSLDDSKPSPDGAPGAGMPAEGENDLGFPREDSSGKLGGSSRRGGQEAHSAPGSPMLGTASSFGSASSAPSLASLPPIRVRADDRGRGLEEHFAEMCVSDLPQKQQQQGDAEGFGPDVPQLINAMPAAVPNPTNFSSAEKPNPGRVFSDDDRSERGDGQKSSLQLQQQQQQRQQHPQLQPQPQPQQQRPNFNDLAFAADAASRPVYYQETRPPPPASDPRQEVPQYDPRFRLQMQVTEKGYLLPQQLHPPPVQAADLLLPQQQQAQQQFVHASPQLVHHHASGTVLSYYQMPIHPQQQLPQAAAHPYNPQLPMYSMPVRQNPAYSSPVPSNLVNTTVAAAIPATAKPTAPIQNTIFTAGVAPPPKPELAADVYRTGAVSSVTQPLQTAQFIQMADTPHQYVGYHSVPHNRPQPAAAAMPGGGYGYEYADVVHPQQIYYTQAAPAAFPTQYQAVMDSPPAAQPPADTKQTKAL